MEISGYDDPRLVPNDLGDDEDTPADAYRGCVHRDACKRIWCRESPFRGLVRGVDARVLARALDCEDCPEWE